MRIQMRPLVNLIWLAAFIMAWGLDRAIRSPLSHRQRPSEEPRRAPRGSDLRSVAAGAGDHAT